MILRTFRNSWFSSVLTGVLAFLFLGFCLVDTSLLADGSGGQVSDKTADVGGTTDDLFEPSEGLGDQARDLITDTLGDLVSEQADRIPLVKDLRRILRTLTRIKDVISSLASADRDAFAEVMSDIARDLFGGVSGLVARILGSIFGTSAGGWLVGQIADWLTGLIYDTFLDGLIRWLSSGLCDLLTGSTPPPGTGLPVPDDGGKTEDDDGSLQLKPFGT